MASGLWGWQELQGGVRFRTGTERDFSVTVAHTLTLLRTLLQLYCMTERAKTHMLTLIVPLATSGLDGASKLPTL